MTQHPLHHFILAARKQGGSDAFIAQLLISSGWPEERVHRAFIELYAGSDAVIPDAPAGRREAARDAFYYLVSFMTLAIWTFALAFLCFVLIERAFPLAGYGEYSGLSGESLSWQIASIIIALPIYLLVSAAIGRELERTPEKAESGIRKWLTYVALFFAAGTVIGDLITFLTWLLDGDITVRFVLKTLTVLVIAGGVFTYYFLEMRRTAALSADHRIP